jgi:hypothetical protein
LLQTNIEKKKSLEYGFIPSTFSSKHPFVTVLVSTSISSEIELVKFKKHRNILLSILSSKISELQWKPVFSSDRKPKFKNNDESANTDSSG